MLERIFEFLFWRRNSFWQTYSFGRGNRFAFVALAVALAIKIWICGYQVCDVCAKVPVFKNFYIKDGGFWTNVMGFVDKFCFVIPTWIVHFYVENIGISFDAWYWSLLYNTLVYCIIPLIVIASILIFFLRLFRRLFRSDDWDIGVDCLILLVVVYGSCFFWYFFGYNAFTVISTVISWIFSIIWKTIIVILIMAIFGAGTPVKKASD